MTRSIDSLLLDSIVAAGLAVGSILLLAYALKLREAFLTGLRGAKPVEPRWLEVLSRWMERLTKILATIARWAIVVFFVAIGWVVLREVADYFKHADSGNFIFKIAVGAMVILGALPWWFWLVSLGGALWAWTYHRNRQRQEAIIEILLEIRRKLG
jgi:phosphatidylglycerophosphatase A